MFSNQKLGFKQQATCRTVKRQAGDLRSEREPEIWSNEEHGYSNQLGISSNGVVTNNLQMLWNPWTKGSYCSSLQCKVSRIRKIQKTSRNTSAHKLLIRNHSILHQPTTLNIKTAGGTKKNWPVTLTPKYHVDWKLKLMNLQSPLALPKDHIIKRGNGNFVHERNIQQQQVQQVLVFLAGYIFNFVWIHDPPAKKIKRPNVAYIHRWDKRALQSPELHKSNVESRICAPIAWCRGSGWYLCIISWGCCHGWNHGCVCVEATFMINRNKCDISHELYCHISADPGRRKGECARELSSLSLCVWAWLSCIQ